MADSWPIYLLLGLYVLAMIGVTVHANRQNRADIKSEAKGGGGDEITSHFLASKNFGRTILLLTTFASVFSGYTVVGVPNEAGVNGFSSVRWVVGILFIGVSVLLIFPRLRRISVVRNYQSPGDFINDRFDSNLLQVLVTLSLCVPQLLYLAVQLHSLGTTLSDLTNGNLEFYGVIIVSSIMILIFEFLGGLRSVAYTDAVQAAFMIIVFITMPIVLSVLYNGGFTGMVVNSDDLPCDNVFL